MRIRETSPCISCKNYPDITETNETDIEYAPSDECPMSIDIDFDLPLDVWETVTCLTGCSCWRQK